MAGLSLVAQAWAMKEQGQAPKPALKLAKAGKKPDATVRSESYLGLVRTVPCMFPGCGKPPPSQACHTNFGKAKGKKNGDTKSGAGCPEHHVALDQGKNFSRQDRRDILAQMALDTHEYLWKAGKIGVLK